MDLDLKSVNKTKMVRPPTFECSLNGYELNFKDVEQNYDSAQIIFNGFKKYSMVSNNTNKT